MDIIFRENYTYEEITEQVNGILHLLQEKYHIDQFREIHLTLTLVDTEGYDVELVDSKTDTTYRVLEVFSKQSELAELSSRSKSHHPMLRLVIDNTR